MYRLLAVLLIGLLFETAGVILLSKGLKQIGSLEKVSARAVGNIALRAVTNPNFLLGVLFEALFFATLIFGMAKSDVSFVWPLTAMGFVFTTIAAHFYLNEKVSGVRWAGVVLIMVGAGLITYSEKLKEAKAKAEATTPAQR